MPNISEFAQFSAVEDHEFENYRPTNVLAIISLLIALVSGVALIHPMLSVVAITSILVALVALHPSRADGIGRPCAFLALALSVFFVSCGNTWFFYRRAVVFREARKNSEHWLGLMANRDYRQAHQLSREHYERIGPNKSLDDHYGDHAHAHAGHTHEDHSGHDHSEHDHSGGQEAGQGASPAEQLKAFLEKFPVDQLVARGEFEWRFEAVDSYHKNVSGEEEVEIRFTISPAGGAGFNLRLIAIRALENRIAYWRIGNIAGERSIAQ